MNPGTDCGHVHSPGQLYPGCAVVAFYQVHEVQQQYEGDGDVSVADVTGRLTNCPLDGVPDGHETDLVVSSAVDYELLLIFIYFE